MLLNEIIVSIVIFFSCINNIFAASEQLCKKHKKFQKNSILRCLDPYHLTYKKVL